MDYKTGRQTRASSGGMSLDGPSRYGTMSAAGRRPKKPTGNRQQSSSRNFDSNPTPQWRSEPQETKRVKPGEIELPTQIIVRDLAELMGVTSIDLIKALMTAGIMANINQVLDHDTAAIVAEDMGFTIVEPVVEVISEEESAQEQVRKRHEYSEEEKEFLEERPPVVVVLGHVDHGKTSLLDVIRETSVQSGEVGGITQHIGAYQVQVNDRLVTFLDTPGHEAFTAMRARGASVTDIAILVVAADDGVQPQTREAISHARAAGVPIIVAMNKMDLATANPEVAKQQLAQEGLVVEDWGGDVICVPVSAKTKQGISELLGMTLLVADIEKLVGNPVGELRGSVIDGRLDRSLGPTATLLVQDGTLKMGDALIVGDTYGRVRAMYDYLGNRIQEAGPATPVRVTGLKEVPAAGDLVTRVASERKAREEIQERLANVVRDQVKFHPVLTLDQVFAQAQAGEVQSLNIILKADVDGSIEPIRDSLEKLDVGDLKVKFVHTGVGNVTESDVNLAAASRAIIVGFDVSVDPAAQRLAESEVVSIKIYNIIYRLIEDVQLALTGMLPPEYEEVIQGEALVREVFTIPRVGIIAGVQIRSGKALRNAKVRVLRDGDPIHEGDCSSLKRFTKDVREVTTGLECGVGVEGLNDLQMDDVLQFYTMEQSK